MDIGLICTIGCIILILGAVLLSRGGGRVSQDTRLAWRERGELSKVEERGETAMEIRGRAAKVQDLVRAQRKLPKMNHYPGLTVDVETVDGEVVEDDYPQLNARNPQNDRLLGDNAAIEKKRKMRGW